MNVPIQYLADLQDGLEFRLPDLPSSQQITTLIPQVARAPVGAPFVMRIKDSAGGAGNFIEASIAAGQLIGPAVSGLFTSTALWAEVVDASGAGYLRANALTSTVGAQDLVPINVPGMLTPGMNVPVHVAPGAALIDRFAPAVLTPPSGFPLVLRLKRIQSAILPVDYLESVIAPGATLGTPSTGSFVMNADSTAWLEVVAGNAGWLYGTAREQSPEILGSLYAVPVIWPGLFNVGESFLVLSPPALTYLRMFRAGFQTTGMTTQAELSVEVENVPGSPIILTLSDHNTFLSQTGLVLSIPPSSLMRIRMLSALEQPSWLTGSLYFETGQAIAIGLFARTRCRPTLAIDSFRLSTAQYVQR